MLGIYLYVKGCIYYIAVYIFIYILNIYLLISARSNFGVSYTMVNWGCN